LADAYPHCPHYDLGPPDEHGVQICNGCGSAVQLRYGGMTTDELELRSTTVVSDEGADVAFDWPGEG